MKILSLSNVILKKTMGNDQKPFYPAWLSNPNPDIPPIWLSYLTTSKHCNCVRHLSERSGAHISTSPLTNKSVEPRKDITLKNTNVILPATPMIIHLTHMTQIYTLS